MMGSLTVTRRVASSRGKTFPWYLSAKARPASAGFFGLRNRLRNREMKSKYLAQGVLPDSRADIEVGPADINIAVNPID